MLHVALDDTDARDGGCTTHLVNRLLDAFPEWDLVGAPRLVRLNPSVPWKTRGNGAVALSLGVGRGEPWPVAESGGRLRLAYPRSSPGGPDPEEALARAAAVVGRWARLGAPGTSPGLVVSADAPPESLYRAAVTRILSAEEVRPHLAGRGHVLWAGGRGLVGALAALAWPAEGASGSPPATWELVAYRAPSRWGTPRDLDPALAAKLDGEPGVFDCADAETGEIVMAPSSPCPLLWGLRATERAPLLALRDVLGPERWAEWTLFRTNHASDDHLLDAACAELRPGSGARLRATVAARPRTVPGGHVLVEVEDGTGRATLAAYRPTGRFRDEVAALRPGDAVVACGSVAAAPDGSPTVNLEKLLLEHAAPRGAKPPPCCGRAMKSRGRGDWRCRVCDRRAGDAAGAAPAAGWREVPTRCRRHLARPLALDRRAKDGG